MSLEDEIDQLRVQLAGCGVAALGGTGEGQVAKEGAYGWSPAYESVLKLRLEYERFRRALLGEDGKVIEAVAKYIGKLDPLETRLPGGWQSRMEAKSALRHIARALGIEVSG